MRVLLIGHVWPEPRSSAAGHRTLSVLELFAELGAELHVACAAALSELAEFPPGLAVSTKEIVLNCSSFDDYIAGLKPDVVIFDRFMTEEQFSWRVEKVCPGALRILDTQDLHSLREARRRAVVAGRDIGVTEDEDWQTDISLREVAAIWRSDLTLMISTAEIELLQARFGVAAQQLLYLPLFATAKNTEGRAEAPLAYAQRQHCVVVGNFRHRPNWDGLQWLARAIWPQVRRRAPEIQCHIYGAYPPPKAQALHSDKAGFLVRGWAPDAAAVTASARLALAPLRFGAGQKGKLLEAMALSTPSVTTSVGAEAMASAATWPGAVADQPEAFAESIVGLYRDSSAWQKASNRAAEIVNSRFEKSLYARDFNNTISAVLTGLEAHRRSNFTGQMLRHHTLRSHQYFSQWIEAKTRNQSDQKAPESLG